MKPGGEHARLSPCWRKKQEIFGACVSVLRAPTKGKRRQIRHGDGGRFYPCRRINNFAFFGESSSLLSNIEASHFVTQIDRLIRGGKCGAYASMYGDVSRLWQFNPLWEGAGMPMGANGME